MNIPVLDGTECADPKEKAARVVAHPAAEALSNAAKQNNCIRTASNGVGGFPKKDAFSLGEWEAAFPGQAILSSGCPNRPRMAMHWARALIRAVAIGDIVIAEICLRGMDRAYAPLPAAEGRKE